MGHDNIGTLARLDLGLGAHRSGWRYLIIGACQRRLDIDNDRVLHVDKIVEPISELYRLVGFGRPRRTALIAERAASRCAVGRAANASLLIILSKAEVD